ncbi:unnamed protein product, partial [Cyprideis torosa]
MTSVWAIVMACLSGDIFPYHKASCWWGYAETPYFFILEGPRLIVIGVNFIFLLNIIRILVTKLREANSSETRQVRKSVRAAIVLLPLLGITNLAQNIPSQLGKSVVEFALWSFSSTFLSSFNGFFVAFLYCFCSKDVSSTCFYT